MLVTGATGNVGRPVVAGLLAAGLPVRAAVRSAEQPVPVGARSVVFDFRDRATWDAAFTGVRTMFLLRPPDVSDVARDLVPAVERGMELGLEHVFMQNLSTTHRRDVIDGNLVVPAGRGRTAFVDALDVADVAVRALVDPVAHAGRAWTPTGPEALTYAEVADRLSTVLGRPVHYVRPGLLRYAWHARRTLGMPWTMVAVTAAIYTVARLGRAAGLTDDVRAVTGHLPRSFEEFAGRQAAVWQQDGGREDGERRRS